LKFVVNSLTLIMRDVLPHCCVPRLSSVFASSSCQQEKYGVFLKINIETALDTGACNYVIGNKEHQLNTLIESSGAKDILTYCLSLIKLFVDTDLIEKECLMFSHLSQVIVATRRTIVSLRHFGFEQ